MWTSLFPIVSAVSLAVGAVAVKMTLAETTSSRCWCADLAVACISLGICCLTFDIWRYQPSKNLSLSAILVVYMEQKLLAVVGWWSVRRFEKDIRDIKKVQEETLMDILKTTSDTKFGKEHNLKSIRNVEEFQNKMTLSCYDDYKPYVEAALNGEQNVLVPETTDFFGATSGTTTGNSKLFPLNLQKMKLNVLLVMATSYAFMKKYIPTFGTIKPVVNVRIGAVIPLTDIGVPKGSISVVLMPYRRHYTSPSAAYDIQTEKEVMYIHAVFALKEPDLVFVICLTSAVLLSFLVVIKRNWKQLVNDIRCGKLDRELQLSDDVRRRLEEHFAPDPKRADELTRIFSENNFVDIVPKLWPHCNMMNAMANGTFELQANIIRSQFGQKVPIVSIMHGATEGNYGMVVFDDGVTKDGITIKDYVIIPRAAFFEFIPLDDINKENPRTLLAHQVSPGADYEMVITSTRGLYRYRTQDVIRIVGFRQSVPVYNIQQRTTDVLNAECEKVPENVITEAVVAAAKTWRSGSLQHFSVTEKIYLEKMTGNISGESKYVFFIELDTSAVMTKEEKSEIDVQLTRISYTYRVYRVPGTMREADVVQVPPGTFDVVKKTAGKNNPLLFVDQYKWPKIIRKPEFLNILLNNEIQ